MVSENLAFRRQSLSAFICRLNQLSQKQQLCQNQPQPHRLFPSTTENIPKFSENNKSKNAPPADFFPSRIRGRKRRVSLTISRVGPYTERLIGKQHYRP